MIVKYLVSCFISDAGIPQHEAYMDIIIWENLFLNRYDNSVNFEV